MDESDDKDGEIDEDSPVFIFEILLPYTSCPNYTSCVIQGNIMNHNFPKQNQEEDIETLCHKMVVMSIPIVDSSPCEFIDALNIEINSKDIIYSSLCQKDEVCDSFTHSFTMLFVSLINLCVLVDVYLMELFQINSSCLGEQLNLVFIKRDMISPYVVDYVNYCSIRRHWKFSMIKSLCYIKLPIFLLTNVFLFTCMEFIRVLH